MESRFGRESWGTQAESFLRFTRREAVSLLPQALSEYHF
jgi:hypothetical protein